MVSKGDDELLNLYGRRAWHFPQTVEDSFGQLFQQSAQGSADVHWIEAGMRYEFQLFGGPQYLKELAAISVVGVADATRETAGGLLTLGSVCLMANPNPVPAPNGFGRTTISWNTGDGSNGRLYVSHGGKYDRHRPADSSEAIKRLETMRARGAQYLLLPATAFWWLDQYQKLRDHIGARYPAIVRDTNTCVIFDLRESSE